MSVPSLPNQHQLCSPPQTVSSFSFIFSLIKNSTPLAFMAHYSNLVPLRTEPLSRSLPLCRVQHFHRFQDHTSCSRERLSPTAAPARHPSPPPPPPPASPKKPQSASLYMLHHHFCLSGSYRIAREDERRRVVAFLPDKKHGTTSR